MLPLCLTCMLAAAPAPCAATLQSLVELAPGGTGLIVARAMNARQDRAMMMQVGGWQRGLHAPMDAASARRPAREGCWSEGRWGVHARFWARWGWCADHATRSRGSWGPLWGHLCSEVMLGEELFRRVAEANGHAWPPPFAGPQLTRAIEEREARIKEFGLRIRAAAVRLAGGKQVRGGPAGEVWQASGGAATG